MLGTLLFFLGAFLFFLSVILESYGIQEFSKYEQSFMFEKVSMGLLVGAYVAFIFVKEKED